MRYLVIILIFAGLCFSPVYSEEHKHILELWDNTEIPARPEISDIKIDAATTALLILDIEEKTTNPQRRPRAVKSVPAIRTLLDYARSKKMTVVFSLTSGAKKETILKEVTPLPDEKIVSSSVDKYFKTDLEKILNAKKIKTVIIVGTAAEGAVLGTSIGSVTRGFKVIIPVDGISSSTIYAEQYVVWHMLNAPATKGNVAITTIQKIIQ